MSMQAKFSSQYGRAAVVVGSYVEADDVIRYCREIGATYFEDGPDDECFVVVLRPDIGPELYTERSLRGSLRKRLAP